MNVEKLLRAMEERAFNGDYATALFQSYLDCLEFEVDLELENDCRRAMDVLPEVLPPEFAGKLEELNKLYEKNRIYTAKYSFKAGLFTGFHQYFTDSPEAMDSFQRTVVEDLFQMPGIQRHRQSWAWGKDCNGIIMQLDAALPKEMREHTASIECAWIERTYDAARQAFHCGYKAALSVIEAVKPFSTLRIKGKMLQTEYELGYLSII